MQEKNILVTAAAQGIGRATTIAFVKEGATVWATDINYAKLLGLSSEHPDCRTMQLDVLNNNGVSHAITHIGPIDILFNCVGSVHQGTILDCSERDWDLSFELNVKSMYRLCRAFLPSMLSAGHGNIINVASVVSSVKAAPNRFAYAATKAAVIGLTRSIALDFVNQGIRCNSISPGTVDSPSLVERMSAQKDPAIARTEFLARQPLGRLGQPEEIADLAVYLASDGSAYITGQNLIIDGGFTL